MLVLLQNSRQHSQLNVPSGFDVEHLEDLLLVARPAKILAQEVIAAIL